MIDLKVNHKTANLDLSNIPIPTLRREDATLNSPIDNHPSSTFRDGATASYQEDKMPNRINDDKVSNGWVTKGPRSPLEIIRGRSFERRTSRLRECELAYSGSLNVTSPESENVSMKVNLSGSESRSLSSGRSVSGGNDSGGESSVERASVLPRKERQTPNYSEMFELYQREVQDRIAALQNIVKEHDEEISQELERREERLEERKQQLSQSTAKMELDPEIDDVMVVVRNRSHWSKPYDSPSDLPQFDIEKLAHKLRKVIAQQRSFFQLEQERHKDVHEALEDDIRELQREKKEMRHRTHVIEKVFLELQRALRTLEVMPDTNTVSGHGELQIVRGNRESYIQAMSQDKDTQTRIGEEGFYGDKMDINTEPDMGFPAQTQRSTMSGSFIASQLDQQLQYFKDDWVEWIRLLPGDLLLEMLDLWRKLSQQMPPPQLPPISPTASLRLFGGRLQSEQPMSPITTTKDESGSKEKVGEIKRPLGEDEGKRKRSKASETGAKKKTARTKGKEAATSTKAGWKKKEVSSAKFEEAKVVKRVQPKRFAAKRIQYES